MSQLQFSRSFRHIDSSGSLFVRSSRHCTPIGACTTEWLVCSCTWQCTCLSRWTHCTSISACMSVRPSCLHPGNLHGMLQLLHDLLVQNLVVKLDRSISRALPTCGAAERFVLHGCHSELSSEAQHIQFQFQTVSKKKGSPLRGGSDVNSSGCRILTSKRLGDAGQRRGTGTSFCQNEDLPRKTRLRSSPLSVNYKLVELCCQPQDGQDAL